MIRFIIGAVVGVVTVSIAQRPVEMNYPIQGIVFSAIAGAAIIGTPLWLIFG